MKKSYSTKYSKILVTELAKYYYRYYFINKSNNFPVMVSHPKIASNHNSISTISCISPDTNQNNSHSQHVSHILPQ